MISADPARRQRRGTERPSSGGTRGTPGRGHGPGRGVVAAFSPPAADAAVPYRADPR